MNIFIIGGTGFLGSHIVNKLILKSHNVIVLTRNLNKEMQFDKTKVKLIQGDIAELNFIQQLPKSIDVIVYVAMPFFKPGRISKSIFFQLKNKTELYFKNTIELAKTIKSTLILTSGASFNTKNNEIADETWPIARIGMAALGKPYDDLISRVLRSGSR